MVSIYLNQNVPNQIKDQLELNKSLIKKHILLCISYSNYNVIVFSSLPVLIKLCGEILAVVNAVSLLDFNLTLSTVFMYSFSS